MDEDNKDIRKPTEHSMKRRSTIHDYFRPGYYHVTISLAQARGQLLGRIAGRADRPDGDAEAPHVELTTIGRIVEQELTTSITKHYDMIEVQEYIIMPEHLHFLLAVHRNIVSKSGRPTHLGQVIAGFKYGCNRRYWALTGRITLAAEPPGTVKHACTPSATLAAPTSPTAGTAATATSTPSTATAATEGTTVLGGSAAKEEHATGQLPPLFEQGYVDVMPVDEAQLETQRQYIRNNPRSRLLRRENRPQLQVQRTSIRTALTLPALQRYLREVCHASQMGEEQWLTLQGRLLTMDGMVIGDSYGTRELLTRRLLPVVCHRKDGAMFEQQKARCMEAAAEGAVLVSARIAPGEQAIMDEAVARGYAVVLVVDNGFPEFYHASKERMALCLKGRLLLVSPWRYRYRLAENGISVPECKAMNCVAQALCRTRDDWWKKNPGG